MRNRNYEQVEEVISTLHVLNISVCCSIVNLRICQDNTSASYRLIYFYGQCEVDNDHQVHD